MMDLEGAMVLEGRLPIPLVDLAGCHRCCVVVLLFGDIFLVFLW